MIWQSCFAASWRSARRHSEGLFRAAENTALKNGRTDAYLHIYRCGVGGFNQTVALTCSAAATLSVCNASPSAVSLNGTSSTPFTVTIATTAQTKGILPPFRIGPSGTKYGPLALTGLALGFTASLARFYTVRNSDSRVPGNCDHGCARTYNVDAVVRWWAFIDNGWREPRHPSRDLYHFHFRFFHGPVIKAAV